MLRISNSSISRMDFTGGFIGGSAKEVALTGLFISDFNRDHAYNRSYPGDSGFFGISIVINLVVIETVFDNNQLLTDVAIVKRDWTPVFAGTVTFISCTFRRSMEGFYWQLLQDGSSQPFLRLSNCTFLDNFVLAKSLFWVKSSLTVSITIENCVFAYNTDVSTLLFIVDVAFESVININNTQFINNQLYIPAYSLDFPDRLSLLWIQSPSTVNLESCLFIDSDKRYVNRPNLITRLVASHLLNNSTAVETDFVRIPNQIYDTLIMFSKWGSVNIRNIVVRDSVQYSYVMQLQAPGADSANVIVQNATVVNTITKNILSIANNRASTARGFVLDCTFQNNSGIIIYFIGQHGLNSYLLVKNCQFTDTNPGEGIGTVEVQLQVLNSIFANVRSLHGAIWFAASTSLRNGEEGRLVVHNSSFVRNIGNSEAADINVVSSDSASLLFLSISDSKFTDFNGQFGSICIQKPNFSTALITSCRFAGGYTQPASGVLVTTHVGGVLTLENVSFFNFIQSDSYILQIKTPDSQALERRLTVLRNVTVSFSSYLAAVKLEGQYWPSLLNTFNCLFERNQGVAILSKVGIWSDSGSVFKDNWAESSACYSQDPQSSAYLRGTFFLNNSATVDKGGCLSLQGVMHCNECVFDGNSAPSSGGAIAIVQPLRVEIYDSHFRANKANSGSALYLDNANVPIVIARSFFKGNIGNTVIQLFSSELWLLKVSISDSTGIELVESSVTAENSSFSGLYGEQNCLIRTNRACNVSLVGCEVIASVCKGDFLSMPKDSNLTLKRCAFLDLSSKLGSIITLALGLIDASFLLVRNVGTAQPFLVIQASNTTIQHSQFLDISGGILKSNNSPLLSILTSSIRNVQSDNSAITCIGTQNVNFTSLTIEKVVTGQVGVHIDTAQASIFKCAFIEVTGGKQGALVIQHAILNMVDSDFLHNKGVSMDSEGGALSLHNVSSRISNCSFVSNVAYIGGAIYWSQTPVFVQENTFKDNVAWYGAKVASRSLRLHLVNSSDLVFVSGQVFAGTLLVGILDNSNQFVKLDSQSQAWLDGSQLTGKLSTIAERGLLRFTGFTVTDRPGQNITVSMLLNTANTVLRLQFRLRSCRRGEILENNKCAICPSEMYSTKLETIECLSCPEGGSCPGNGNLYPNPGFWRPAEVCEGVFECPNVDACLGHKNYISPTGTCEERYEGNKCQSCKPGNSRSGPDKCAACPSKTSNQAIIALVAILVCIVVGVLTRSALKKAEKRVSQFSTLQKLLLNYLQMTVLITRFPLNLPDVLQTSSALHEYAGNSGEQFLSVDCLISQPTFFKAVAMAILPIVLVMINLTIWTLVLVIFSLFRKPLAVREKCVCSAIVSLFYFYPMIVRTALSLFQCVSILPEERWLRLEMSIPCWDHRHSYYALAAGLPTVILWGFGVPALTLLLLIKFRKRLQEVRVLTMLGFLYVNYTRRFYYWEVVIVYRKLSVVILYTLAADLSAPLQLLMLSLLLIITTLLQVKFTPFNGPQLNRAELLSTAAILMTVYAGLYFSYGSLSVTAEAIVYFVVLLVNIAFLLYVLKISLQGKMRQLIRYLRMQIGSRKLQVSHKLMHNHKMAYIARLKQQV